MEDAREALSKAEAAINRKNEQYEAIKKELEDLKREIVSLLNRLRGDKAAARMIDVALLMRLKKEMTLKMRNWANAVDFRNKLGMILDNLSGVGSLSEEELATRQEYDTTMKTIVSLTDMIDYYEEQEKRLLMETTQEAAAGDEQPKERPKTQEETNADLARAEEILELELRPRRQERAKSRDKLLDIISTQARMVDMDPRDMDGINSVEEMNAKREALKLEADALEKEADVLARHIRQLERKVMLSGGGILKYVASRVMRKDDLRELEGQAEGLKEPDDTEEEQFVYRYKITQRELNRRYNQLLELKDSITEHAYDEDDGEP